MELCPHKVLTFRTDDRAIDTVLATQHPDGGFGGGPGQLAHLLPTYAAVCALAVAGRPGPGGGWDDIDRYVATVGPPFLHHRFNSVRSEGTRCTNGSYR